MSSCCTETRKSASRVLVVQLSCLHTIAPVPVSDTGIAAGLGRLIQAGWFDLHSTSSLPEEMAYPPPYSIGKQHVQPWASRAPGRQQIYLILCIQGGLVTSLSRFAPAHGLPASHLDHVPTDHNSLAHPAEFDSSQHYPSHRSLEEHSQHSHGPSRARPPSSRLPHSSDPFHPGHNHSHHAQRSKRSSRSLQGNFSSSKHSSEDPPAEGDVKVCDEALRAEDVGLMY